MRTRTLTAISICLGSVLAALSLTLQGNGLTSLQPSARSASSISPDSTMAIAMCAAPDSRADTDDIFFISCGGIY